MLRAFLRLQLLGTDGLCTVGLPLSIMNVPHLLYDRVGCLLSDGDGIRQALQWLGAAAVKLCFRQWDVMKETSDMDRAEHDAEGLHRYFLHRHI